MAIFAVNQLIQPSNSGVIHCLSDIETKIETAVVTSAKDQHKLSRLMLSLSDPQIRVLLGKVIWIEESGLVSEMFTALAEMLGEVSLGLPLEDVGLLKGDAVPKLGLSLMEEVDGR